MALRILALMSRGATSFSDAQTKKTRLTRTTEGAALMCAMSGETSPTSCEIWGSHRPVIPLNELIMTRATIARIVAGPQKRSSRALAAKIEWLLSEMPPSASPTGAVSSALPRNWGTAGCNANGRSGRLSDWTLGKAHCRSPSAGMAMATASDAAAVRRLALSLSALSRSLLCQQARDERGRDHHQHDQRRRPARHGQPVGAGGRQHGLAAAEQPGQQHQADRPGAAQDVAPVGQQLRAAALHCSTSNSMLSSTLMGRSTSCSALQRYSSTVVMVAGPGGKESGIGTCRFNSPGARASMFRSACEVINC